MTIGLQGQTCLEGISIYTCMGQVTELRLSCYLVQLIAKPGNKTAAVWWPDPYNINMINFLKKYPWKTTPHRSPILGHVVMEPGCISSTTQDWRMTSFIFAAWSSISRSTEVQCPITRTPFCTWGDSSYSPWKQKMAPMEFATTRLTHWGRDKMADIFKCVFLNENT